ncbi:MAG: hypothetical protein U1F57_01730 [bacterium]
MAQYLIGSGKMATLQPEVKAHKRRTRKARSVKAKGLKSKKEKPLSFFQHLSAQFHEVAPLDWLPGPYQLQMRAAKPIQIRSPRKKKETKTPLH